MDVGAVNAPTIWRSQSCSAVTTIGLDVGKSFFQVHGIDPEGKVLIRRQLKRRYVLAFFEKLPPCLVVIEACATSRRPSGLAKDLLHGSIAHAQRRWHSLHAPVRIKSLNAAAA
jgi:transposase